MLSLAILSIGTVVIGFMCLLTMMRARSLVPALPTFLVYYWTLFGAWSFVFAKLADGNELRSYLEYRLFRIHLDETYALTLVLYTFFILIIQVCLFIATPPTGLRRSAAGGGTAVSHFTLLLIGGLAGLLSYLLVRGELSRASDANVSVYILTRAGGTGSFPLYTLHQVSNLIAQITLCLGFAVVASGKEGRIFTWRGRTPVLICAYLVPLAAVFLFNFTLGNRSGLFGSLVAGVVLYLLNARHPKLFWVCTGGLVGLWFIALVALARGGRITDVASAAATLGDSVTAAFPALGDQLVGSESISAHMSLYGVLKYDLPLSYGSSIVALVASVVPRNLWPERPVDTYTIYASGIGAPTDQNFTIHHAAAWYLNFGIPGVLIGALIMGGVWGAVIGSFSNPRTHISFWRILTGLGPAMTAFYVPAQLLRSGPEAYKALFIESLLFPTLVFWCSNYAAKSLRKCGTKRSSQPQYTRPKTPIC